MLPLERFGLDRALERFAPSELALQAGGGEAYAGEQIEVRNNTRRRAPHAAFAAFFAQIQCVANNQSDDGAQENGLQPHFRRARRLGRRL